jgi:hypothetical protein
MFSDARQLSAGLRSIQSSSFACSSLAIATAFWLVEHKGIEPHVPVWDKRDRKDSTFAASDFIWDQEANEYHCPGGHVLRSEWRVFINPRKHVTKAEGIVYRSRQKDCWQCSLKARCCPNTPMRKIARSVHEEARDVARNVMDRPEYQ